MLKATTNNYNVTTKETETIIVIPPDGGWGWIIVAATFLMNFTIDGIMYTFGVFLEDISLTFGCSTTKVALANSLITGIFFLSGPLVSAFINTFGYRRVAVVGGLVSFISLIATSYCKHLTPLLILYGVGGGIGFGMVFLSSIVVVSFYFERWRALAQSITSCGSSIGIICFPLIFTMMLKEQSWRFKFKLLGLFGLLCSLCGLCFRLLPPIRLVNHHIPTLVKDSEEVKKENEFTKKISRYNNVEYPTGSELYNLSIIEKGTSERSSTSFFTNSESSTPTESVVTIKSFTRSKTSEMSKMKASVDRLQTVYEDQDEHTPTCRERCHQVYQHFCCSFKQSTVAPVRPLYRDDIFYVGSLTVLPEYVKSTQLRSEFLSPDMISLGYHLSVTRATTQADIKEELQCCVCFPESMKRSLATLLDLSVLQSPSFVLISISGLFTVLGLYTPFMFLAERAIARGMERHLAYHLITTIGVANTLGRIGSGTLSSLRNVNSLTVSYMCLTLAALVLLISSLSYTVFWQFCCAFVYGLSMGCVVALRPIIIVDMVGLQKLTNSFGISLVFQGFACLAGIPLSGYFKTITNNYDLSFYFAGGVTLISAALLVSLKFIQTWEKNRSKN